MYFQEANISEFKNFEILKKKKNRLGRLMNYHNNSSHSNLQLTLNQIINAKSRFHYYNLILSKI